MRPNVAILATTETGTRIAELVRQSNPSARVEIAPTGEAFAALEPLLDSDWILFSFGTSVIVHAATLSRLDGGAFNFHAASPEYPGRDPHHFAIYDGARRYGATAHEMAKEVDAGPILAVEWFDTGDEANALGLLEQANTAAMNLAEKLVPRLVAGERHTPLDVSWGPRKTTRQDFLSLCRIEPDCDAEEFDRRHRATAFGDRQNLYTDLHGWRFRLDDKIDPKESTRDHSRWSEFTEDGYRQLLDLAREKYRFSTFAEQGEDRHVLWRHDVDISMHRALRLAQIEHERGVISTFFFMLRSSFYTLAEPEILDRARRITDMGHKVGLHFQPEGWPGMSWNSTTIERYVTEDRDRLALLLDRPIDAVSFHNPDQTGLDILESTMIAGLPNTYSKELREKYGYCSDSNGYWRFSPLGTVLAERTHERLQVLTHPGWWTPEPMPPRARIERCIAGRAAANMQRYDRDLLEAGRCNLV